MKRTFGLELEFSDADKQLIKLPDGYKWTENKFTTMINSDGSRVTNSGRFGGEINTRPFEFTPKDLKELKAFIQTIKVAGANLLWNTGFDAHLYIKDLGIENIKKVFLLSYYVAPYIKKIFDCPEWFDNKYQSPSPAYDHVRKLMNIKAVGEIKAVFANGSDRGHIRYYMNIVPMFEIGTIEFRIFNSTFDFAGTMEQVKFMYRFVDFAVNHSVEDYTQLNSIEQCLKAFKIKQERIPLRHEPLIFAEEHTNNTTVVGESFRKSKGIMNAIVEHCKNAEEVHVVNSFFLDIEQLLSGKKILLYSKDLFTEVAYKIINEDCRFELAAPFDYLEFDKGNKAERLAKLFIFSKVKSAATGTDSYHSTLFQEFVRKKDTLLKRAVKQTEKIIERLEPAKITFIKGDIGLAIHNCKNNPKATLIYQSEFNAKFRSLSNALAKYCDDLAVETWPTSYANLEIEKCNYIVIGKNKFLPLTRVYSDNRTYVYSNVAKQVVNKFALRKTQPVLYKKIPNDYVITENSKLQFIRSGASQIDYLRMLYMKKDILLGSGVFYHLWFLDNYLFGATIFDYSKEAYAGADIIWMKSDFVVNNNVEKLSKLLIMAVLSKEFKDELDIRYKSNVGIIATTVFSDKPVSMKYRGVFDLDRREGGKLYYRGTPGKYPSNQSVIADFIKRFRK